VGGSRPYNTKESTESASILSLPQEFLPLSTYSKSLEYACAYTYLKGRGVTKEDILRYNIGYCERGEYAKRIIIPSYDSDGNLNFFSSRVYDENTPNKMFKYKNPPWSKDIIGFQLLINWGEPVTLVEGGFDAIAVRKNAIPLFGTTMSNTLKEAIIANGVWRVNILLDNDALSKAIEIYEFIEKLSNDEIDVHLIKLDDKDPSVLGYEKINEIIENSHPFGFKEMIRLKMTL
jgi:DNA primase